MSSSIQLATSPASVNNGSAKVLFVEGENNSIDVEVVSTLLEEVDITVRPLNSSPSLKTCAKAFFSLEPGYFFLIDRDHHGEETVAESWERTRMGKSNLLIWKKKEIENYFLDPAFLMQSKFIKENMNENILKRVIVEEGNKRVFQLAANQTIIQIRECLRNEWIECFKNLHGFDTEENAISKLLSMKEFQKKNIETSELLNCEYVESLFRRILKNLTGGERTLKWDCGRWQDFIQAKPILNQLICSGKFFVNKIDGMSENLDEKNKINIILKDLVKTGEHLPEDFIELKKIMQQLRTMSSTRHSAA